MKHYYVAFSLLIAIIVVLCSLFVSSKNENRKIIAATSWVQSPVTIEDEKYIIDSCVIKDGSTYKMWYTHLKMDFSLDQLYNQLKTLQLDDLINALQNYQWDSFMTNLADLNPDLPAIMTILDGIYTEIGYATSPDGKIWTVVDSDVLTTTSFWISVGAPSVIQYNVNDYRMWYTRLDSTLDEAQLQKIITDIGSADPTTRRTAINNLLNSTGSVIGYATSANGIGWAVQNPTAFAGNTSAYKLLNSVGAPSVILDGATYKMWYTGLKTDFTSAALDTMLQNLGTLDADDFVDIINSTNLVIGYASSLDGSTWTLQNNEVLSAGIALWQSVADPCVVKTGNTYSMWYTSAVSNLTNVSVWRSVLNELLNLNMPSLWNSMKTKGFSDFVTDLMSINIAGLQSVFANTYGVIGKATSSDGITWTVQPADLIPTSINLFGGVGTPSVWLSSSKTEIWFSQGIETLTWQKLVDRIQGVGINSGLRYGSASSIGGLAGGGGGAPSPITGTGEVCYPLSPTGYTTVNITLTSEDSMCAVFIPKNTLARKADTSELKCISCALMLSPPAPPEGKVVFVAYNMEPDGAYFEPSVTVTIKYDPESLPEGVDETSLKLAYFNSTTNTWDSLSGVTIDVDKHSISGKTEHFTAFGIISDKGTAPKPPTPETPPVTPPPPTLKPANFVMSALTISPTIVKSGETVTVDVIVTNTGEQAGTYTVKLLINGVVSKTEEVTLRAGDSETVVFTVLENVAGVYSVVIDRLSGNFIVLEVPIQPPVITPPVKPVPPTTNWALIAGGIVFGVMLTVLVGWFLITREQKP
jgi:hypothetical protein